MSDIIMYLIDDLRWRSAFIDAPRFVMEVLSDSTEQYDREEKKDLYRQQV